MQKHKILLSVADGVIETDNPVTSVYVPLLVVKVSVFTVDITWLIFPPPTTKLASILLRVPASLIKNSSVSAGAVAKFLLKYIANFVSN